MLSTEYRTEVPILISHFKKDDSCLTKQDQLDERLVRYSADVSAFLSERTVPMYRPTKMQSTAYRTDVPSQMLKYRPNQNVPVREQP